MKGFAKSIALTALCVTVLTGCLPEEETSDDDSYDSGSTGSTGSTGSSDALDYPQIAYTFSCPAPVGGSNTVNVSNGPCVSQQKSYTRATSCNLVGNDYTFNHVGKPFYQCLVNNSTGDYRAYYQQYLDFYSSAGSPSRNSNSLVATQKKSIPPEAQFDESFTDLHSIDAWIVSSINSIDSYISPSQADGAMNVEMPAANDQYVIGTLLSVPVDLNGSVLSVDVYLPESYLVNGKFVQLYIEDDLGNKAVSTLPEELLSLWVMSGAEQSPSGTGHYGWMTLSYNVTQSGVSIQSNQDTLSAWNLPFDVNLSKITSIGFVFGYSGADAQKVSVKIDNVIFP